jgi:hypothetical protein
MKLGVTAKQQTTDLTVEPDLALCESDLRFKKPSGFLYSSKTESLVSFEGIRELFLSSRAWPEPLLLTMMTRRFVTFLRVLNFSDDCISKF